MEINYDSFMNLAGVDYKVYYHSKRKCFVVRDKLPANSRYFIETPYREVCQRLAWKYFYAMLDEEELALVESFNERHGFFDFMRTTGLIAVFDAAMERAITKVFAHWESDNNLAIDWKNAVLE